jgi:hypothetical protein
MKIYPTIVGIILLACMLLGVLPGGALGQGLDKAKEDAEWRRIEETAKKAVAYLVSKQNRDGSIVENNRHHTTMTSLAIMGMLAVGHKPADDTKEGEALRKALGYVLRPDRIDEKGYFGNQDGSRMYGQGIITLMLAEVVGMGVDDKQDRLIRERLQAAIDLILRAQSVRKRDKRYEGGWRYTPDADDADLSVVCWQLIALRAAKNAGLEVPKEAIAKAISYIKRSYKSAAQPGGEPRGFFTYTPGENRMRFGSGSGGFLALQLCGQYEAPEVKGAANYYLDYQIPGLNSDEYVYYGIYYYAQGMYQQKGKYAERARDVVREYLIEKQKPDGSWPLGKKDHTSGVVYVTSLALLSLSIHYHYLPIYQR